MNVHTLLRIWDSNGSPIDDVSTSSPSAHRSRSLPPLSALVIEPRGVLYDDTVWPRWLVQLLHRVGVRTEFHAFLKLLQRDHLIPVYEGHCDYWTALRRFLSEVGLSRGQMAEVEAAGRTRWRQCEEEIHLFPGVVPTLARLEARGIGLAILANSCCDCDRLHERLERLGVDRYFRAVLVSRQLGHALPDSRAYEAMLDTLSVAPHDIGFVSDDAVQRAGAAQCRLIPIGIDSEPADSREIMIGRFSDLASVSPPDHPAAVASRQAA